jgi:predicted regulator of Ras-like GTPase activity (Roadblock/LC7/MglB family)
MPKQMKPSAKKPQQPRDNTTTNLTRVLRRLRIGESRITGSAVVNPEGQIIAAWLPRSAQKNRVGSIASAMFAIGQQTVAEFEQGILVRVLIESASGLTLITTAAPDAILVILARKDAKLGSLFMQIDRAVAEIRGLVDAQEGKL